VYQALTEKRPYRESLPKDVVLGMMEKDSTTRLDPQCLDVLKQPKSSTKLATTQKAQAAGK
jgi:HD-GYP domain-containing protein (c-di-GMP phosphodiesterase class II)